MSSPDWSIKYDTSSRRWVDAGEPAADHAACLAWYTASSTAVQHHAEVLVDHTLVGHGTVTLSADTSAVSAQ